MRAHDAIDLAARNLRESKLRNGLTTLGVAVGVASLVAMLSLGAGLQQLANRRLNRSGLFDTILVSSRRDFRGFARRDAAPAPARPLNDEALRTLGALPHVTEVIPDVRFLTEVRLLAPGAASGEDKLTATPVAGLPPSARQNETFENMQGRFFAGPAADEAILLADFAKELSPDPAKLLGHEIELRYAERQPLPAGGAAPDSFSVVRNTHRLRVVGIVEREPYGGFRGMAHAGVFIPLHLAAQLNVMQPADLRGLAGAPEAGRTYMTVMVRVTSPTQVESVQNQVKQMGFGTFSLLDATRNLGRFFAILDLFLGIFGSLALAVAALGIVNTLVMAILERRREIGIMKAVGASDSDVQRLFFAEAGAMGILGGIGGVALGWAIGRVINYGTNIYLRRQQLPPENLWYVPWWLVAGAVAFSIIVTLVAGLYPAIRAARLDPVQALRYE
jgi:putative ABC transport system permease protein